MQRIVVVGGGFAGLWAAVGAARKLAELGIGRDKASVTLINRDSWHSIRVRNYETDLSEVRVPLADILVPADVDLIVGDVVGIDRSRREISVSSATADSRVVYDGLVLAAGSSLARPQIPGLAEHAFDIDTYDAAIRLDDHLRSLKPDALHTVAIVGGGLTGIEIACEMPDRLRALGLASRVVLLDAAPRIGSGMSADAARVIDTALDGLGVERRTDVVVEAITRDGIVLKDGKTIEAGTVVWTAGMRANPLSRALDVATDGLGRVPVDTFLRVIDRPGVFAAGDIAAAPLPDGHTTVMSCQHARPMGRLAGHNVVCDLLGLDDLVPLDIDRYVTCMDLGPFGAIYTQGWDRAVVSTGADAKTIKETINRVRIYPPRSRDRAEILQAAAPIIQAPAIPWRNAQTIEPAEKQ
jgi:NADH dehydrogenase